MSLFSLHLTKHKHSVHHVGTGTSAMAWVLSYNEEQVDTFFDALDLKISRLVVPC